MDDVIHLYQLAQDSAAFAGASDAEPRDAVLLVPSAMVSTFRLDVSQVPRRYLAQALPALLEERLVEDPAQVHIAYGQPDSDQQLVVYVVNRSRLQEWLDTARVCGVQPLAIYPDFFALECSDSSLPVMVCEQHVSARFSEYQGFSGTLQELQAIISHAFPELPVSLVTDDSLDASALTPGSVSPLSESIQLSGEPVNLLQGTFAPRPRRTQTVGYPWKVMAAALLALLAVGLNSWSQQRYLQQQNAQLQGVVDKSYQRIFAASPDADWKQTASYQLAVARQYSSSDALSGWRLMLLLDEAISRCGSCDIQEFSLDKNRAVITVKVVGSELLLQQLNRHPQLKLEKSQQREAVVVLEVSA